MTGTISKRRFIFSVFFAFMIGVSSFFSAPNLGMALEEDSHIKAFLDKKRNSWRDLNIPYEDGIFLRDFVIANKVRSIVEIGTSTGHSGLWMGWGLSKTGGKLWTFEIDVRRHNIAVENFKDAKLAPYIQARLESARTGVLKVPLPIDMVFLDGDRGHYRFYFENLAPRLSKKGCFVTHNVDNPFWDIKGYLEMVRAAKGFHTTIIRPSNEGIALTCRTSGDITYP